MEAKVLSFSVQDRGNRAEKVLRCDLTPGLYAFSFEADASQFNWEELYITLNIYGNVNQRTGPWDFNLLDNNRPVLPAYWVWLDGRKLGLWFVNRPSARQIDERRFRGELCFRVATAGAHEIRFEPYRQFELSWQKIRLEPEPFDRWESAKGVPPNLMEALLPAQMPTNRFAEGFLNSVAWVKDRVNAGQTNGLHLPILAAAWRWLGDRDALVAARKVIESHLNSPVWGNTSEDGYGYNGDMGAAIPLFGIAVAMRWMSQELQDLRGRILEKLQRQGDAFLEMALLHRGYWGGSILQDHGFVSFSWFTCAAYALHDLIPSAGDWLAFGVPRMKRTLKALPRDGVVPNTSYHALWMYVDKLVLFRELHRQATGEDIYELDCIRSIPFAARSCYIPERRGFAFPSPRGDITNHDGAQAFLAQMSSDLDAQWLLKEFLVKDNLQRKRPDYHERYFQKDWLWALLFGREPAISASQYIHRDLVCVLSGGSEVETRWFRDSGVGVVRARSSLVMAKCGAPVSLTSHANTTCNCDKAAFAPLAGNFVYLHEGRKVLHTAEGGYRMQTLLGNVLLVDGHGQKGDRGIPMSHPDTEYHGEKILRIGEEGTALLLDLTPAYKGLREYVRQIGLTPEGLCVVKDIVVSSRVCALDWRFNTYQCNPWKQIDTGIWELAVEGQKYLATVSLDGCDFTTRTALTPTVWAYVNDNEDRLCHHLSVEVARLTGKATMQFTLMPCIS